MEIKNKVAIVTGASMGIGEAVARLLTKKGAKVALVARSKAKLEKLSKELPESFVVLCDMTKPVEIKSMIKKVLSHYKRIDILVNNAGRGYDASVEGINLGKYQQLFDLNLAGPLFAMQQVIPIMRKQKEGSIVNISSGTALMFLTNMSAYSSLKRALVGISLTAREELKEENIKVSVVYPYITISNFDKNSLTEQKQIDEEGDWMKNLDNPPDTSGYIAEKIVDGIKNNEAEVYAHDWMKR